MNYIQRGLKLLISICSGLFDIVPSFKYNKVSSEDRIQSDAWDAILLHIALIFVFCN
ncbi:hypothetical protein KPL47_21570 [Clostridium estertheticum]|uniref:hypothetical protein n=1 Tax=Clostridium estertheticum TaxID=238834 RepID=UPI001C0DB4FF|nr:hypothetical protein [Clostridium estertheticum]MBU3178904.1 hypothetical protein [Clostridium estertheticum]